MLRFSVNLGFLWPDRPLFARIDAAAVAAGFRAVDMHPLSPATGTARSGAAPPRSRV